MDKNKLIELIKSKRELSGISDSLVSESLDKVLSNVKRDLQSLNKSDIKLIVKSVRSELRRYVGQFQISSGKKEKLLDNEDFESLLNIHSSTKERILFYKELKDLILNLKIKSILDIGCGINPIALANKSINYFACDINESDLSIVREYFNKHQIQGKVYVYDLRKFANDLPEADLCLIFKVLDTIEKKGHKIAESLLLNSKCKYILVSFSTKKLSGKSMNFPRRVWFEKILLKLNLSYKTLNSGNEIFYLIDKSAK